MADVPDRLLPTSRSTASRVTPSDFLEARPLPRSLVILLTCGVGGTVLFPIVYVILGATRPGYDAWRLAISALSLGPMGWVQQLDFTICGVSVLWMAFVWRKILAGGVCASLYPVLRGIEGGGLLAIAIFSQDPGYGYPPATPVGPGTSTLGGTLHLAFTILVVQAMCLGLLVIARRFWKHPLWRGWATFSVACGLLLMVCMVFFVLAQNTHSVITRYAGLFERLATNADTIWSLVLLARLWSRRETRLWCRGIDKHTAACCARISAKPRYAAVQRVRVRGGRAIRKSDRLIRRFGPVPRYSPQIFPPFVPLLFRGIHKEAYIPGSQANFFRSSQMIHLIQENLPNVPLSDTL